MTLLRAKQEAEEDAKKLKFSLASKINRVKKGKKERFRSEKPDKKTKKKVKEIDPDELAKLRYLGNFEEEEFARQAASGQ